MHPSFRNGFEKTSADESWAYKAPTQYSGGKNLTGVGVFAPIRGTKSLLKHPLGTIKQTLTGNANLAKKTWHSAFTGLPNKLMTGMSLVGAVGSASAAAKSAPMIPKWT